MADEKYSNIVNLVFNQPWAILPSVYTTITDLIAFRAAGGILTDEEIQERIGYAAYEAASPNRSRRSQAVAVIPLRGVMAQRMNLMEAMSGGVSTEIFGKVFSDAVANPEIGGIVIDVDSPGGSVFGVQELANTIFSARGTKPIVAIANSMMASAAYWVASQADEIIITPGGQAGSIGVFTAHNDMSAMLEAEGQHVTLISAGKKKVDGNPFEPLSEDAKADLQSRVNSYYTDFTGAVARGRGAKPDEVRNGFGEGAAVGAAEAVRVGLADRIGTLDMAIQRAGGRQGFQAVATDGELVTLTPEPGTEIAWQVGSRYFDPLSEKEYLMTANGCEEVDGADEKAAAESVDDTEIRERRLRLSE